MLCFDICLSRKQGDEPAPEDEEDYQEEQDEESEGDEDDSDGDEGDEGVRGGGALHENNLQEQPTTKAVVADSGCLGNRQP